MSACVSNKVKQSINKFIKKKTKNNKIIIKHKLKN